MASSGQKDLDSFLKLIQTNDPKSRLSVSIDLIKFLEDPLSNFYSNDINAIIDALLPWISSSNYKVAQAGLDIFYHLCHRMGTDFKAFVPPVLSAVIDRLGDSKDAVRERCRLLISKMLEKEAVTPLHVLEKMIPCFSNKNINVRDEVLICLASIIDEHGIIPTILSKYLPLVVKLLTDPSMSVKDNATKCLVTMYRHYGDRLRSEISKTKVSGSVPQPKIHQILAKFDEVKAAGDMLQSAQTFEPVFPSGEDTFDEPDRQIVPPTKIKRSSSAGPAPMATPSTTAQRRIIPPSSARSGTSTGAGAVDEEFFFKAFEERIEVQLFSPREIEDHMIKIRETIGNTAVDWNKRVDALKKIRGLINAGASKYDEFFSQLRVLEPPYEYAVKDLRSQVVREACITIAYLSLKLENKFDYFAECILQHVIQLLMNAAKIISSSGLVCLRLVIQNTHSPRLLSTINQHLSSKSKEIRKAMCELINLVLTHWSPNQLLKVCHVLEEAIKKGISDADSDARAFARKAYWIFKEKYPTQAKAMLKGLEPAYQRALQNEGSCMTSSSSSNSLSSSTNNCQSKFMTPRNFRHASEGGTTTMPRRVQTPTSSLRSTSAIDLQAAQRAKVRAQYAALARQKVGSGASLPRPRKIITDSGPGSLGASQERTGRTRSRVAGVSQSQPSSRSGSPSSRQNLYTLYSGSQYSSIDNHSGIGLGRRRSSASTPRSTGASRETSPSRNTSLYAIGSRMNSVFRSRYGVDRPPIQPTQGRPVMAQKILQQSLEAESALAEALNLDQSETDGLSVRMSPRKSSGRLFDDHSDDNSETSSVCSERSSDSFRRPFDSWTGSQQRLYRDVWEPTAKDINEIIANCESTHWSDRKEGLVALQAYLQAGNLLQPTELKRVTDNFTKMFMDSHTKVFSLFLDTLNDLIVTHKTDLNFWLYLLLTRLLNKLGGDLLGSIQNKIYKSLDVVRQCFSSDVQMYTVLRFLCDATQTPNARVKTAACNYITKLAAVTDPGLAFLPPSPGQVKDTATAALTKMIGWTMGDSIKQGSELRRAAQEAIIALFNLNTPQVTLRFSQLPKEYQEAAANLIQGRVRRASNSNNVGVTGRGSSPPVSPGSPTQIASSSLSSTVYATAPSMYSTHMDAENLNPEDVYRSLQKTTAEIQNYSYESGGKKIDREETSQDSGISQMSSGGGDIRSLTQHMEELQISRNQANRTNSTGRVLTVRDCNGIDSIDNINQVEGFHLEGQINSSAVDESESMRKVVESLKSPVEGDESNSQNCLSDHDKKTALSQLVYLIRQGSCLAIMEHFKAILRVLVTQLGSNESSIKILALTSLTEMIGKTSLAESFNNYIELLVLKVLQTFKDSSKEVQKSSELCASSIATNLAPELVIRVLLPLITTGDYPINLGAIKTLRKLVETHERDAVQNYLADLMSELIQAYDNKESSVRKSAVFCMVALYISVGEEELRPHLSSLNGSKLKLLHLYIKRAQQGSSVPTSPKNQSTSDS